MIRCFCLMEAKLAFIVTLSGEMVVYTQWNLGFVSMRFALFELF